MLTANTHHPDQPLPPVHRDAALPREDSSPPLSLDSLHLPYEVEPSELHAAPLVHPAPANLRRGEPVYHRPGYFRRKLDNLVFNVEMLTLRWCRMGVDIMGPIGVGAGIVGITNAVRQAVAEGSDTRAIAYAFAYIPTALIGYGLYKLDRAIEKRMEREVRRHL